MKFAPHHQPPILGHFTRLADLIDGAAFGGGTLRQQGFIFLGGLPGSVDLRTGAALHVRLKPEVEAAAKARCCNGELGSIRVIKSEYWGRQGLLPVFGNDAYHIGHFLLATVPAKEHELFAEYRVVPDKAD